jgi:hypothetical protein
MMDSIFDDTANIILTTNQEHLKCKRDKRDKVVVMHMKTQMQLFVRPEKNEW